MTSHRSGGGGKKKYVRDRVPVSSSHLQGRARHLEKYIRTEPVWNNAFPDLMDDL